MKYSRALLEPIVKDCTSTSEVMRRLGLALSGGTNSYLKRLFKKLNIDTSHFLGQASNRGKTDPKKITFQDVLVYDRLNGRRENVYRLKRALLESGVPEQCSECGLPPEWNGKSIVLQIDHKDGNGVNNSPYNVRFLCPNCHSQTETFGTRNRPPPLTLSERITREIDKEVLRDLKKAANI
jgi:5-methylcytosine-specific restriction endonuclease McrA